MERIVLELKDPAKRALLLALLAELDFVRVVPGEPHTERAGEVDASYSFFASAGMWAGREVDATSLRAAAWGRG